MNARISPIDRVRAIHLIDIENLCGVATPTATQVEEVRWLYMKTISVGPRDLVVIASAHINCLAAGTGWPGKRYLVRSGKDGADVCLAEIMCDEHLAERFERVYIASGDGGLAPFVAHVATLGAHTVAVSRAASISVQMRLAANETVYLPLSDAAARVAA